MASDGVQLKQILVADDSQTIHKAVRLTLPENEFQVVVASNGKEALDLVKSKKFDLVLADVNMPELSGYDLAQAVKVRLGMESLPVVLMCGTFDKFDQDRFIWSKANHRIWKPFETTSFIEIVRQYLKPLPNIAQPKAHVDVPRDDSMPALLRPVIPAAAVLPGAKASFEKRQEVVMQTPNPGVQVEKEIRKWLASDAGKALLQELVKREVNEVLAKIEKELVERIKQESVEEEMSTPAVNIVNPF